MDRVPGKRVFIPVFLIKTQLAQTTERRNPTSRRNNPNAHA